jgi:hypothetical protein
MRYKSTPMPVQLIDKLEGELINIEKLSEDMDIGIDEIVERLLITKELSLLISSVHKAVEAQFIKLMREQKAKKYTNDEVTINILPQYSYEYIIEKIDLLKTLLPDEKFNEIFTKQYKVNRNVLKGIRTLGGEIKKITEEMEIKSTLKPTVNIIKNE